MVINVSGSFILGVLFALLVERNIGFSVVLGLLAGVAHDDPRQP